MSTCLPCGLTPEQVVEGLSEIATLGLDALGQPLLAQLVPIAQKIALDGVTLIEQGANPGDELTAEVDAEQSAADAVELAKVGPK